MSWSTRWAAVQLSRKTFVLYGIESDPDSDYFTTDPCYLGRHAEVASRWLGGLDGRAAGSNDRSGAREAQAASRPDRRARRARARLEGRPAGRRPAVEPCRPHQSP